ADLKTLARASTVVSPTQYRIHVGSSSGSGGGSLGSFFARPFQAVTAASCRSFSVLNARMASSYFLNSAICFFRTASNGACKAGLFMVPASPTMVAQITQGSAQPPLSKTTRELPTAPASAANVGNPTYASLHPIAAAVARTNSPAMPGSTSVGNGRQAGS